MKKTIPPVFKKPKKLPLEKDSEAKLRKGVLKRGGQCYKFSAINRKGVSDRIVLLYGMVVFVEMKREKITTLSRKQVIFKNEVYAQDCYFYTVSGDNGVVEFLKYMDSNKSVLKRLSRMVLMLFPLPKNKVFK